MTAVEIVFWFSFVVVVGAHAGYPLVLCVWSRLAPWAVARGPRALDVSVVVAVRDEAPRMAARIGNLLASDYPGDRLEVLVVSDGSRDDTVTRALAVAAGDRRVRVIDLPVPQGKAAALNAGVAAARGEIIVFADARQRFALDAIRRLVENFADPAVGVASGRLVLEGAGTPAGRGVGLYWSHEVWLRARESEVGSTLGATGAIYAIRRSLYEPIPHDTILDDVLVPMQAVLAGSRAILDERALAFDAAPPSGRLEFRRKVRTLYGNYQLLAVRPDLLSPVKNPVSGRFVAHKLARLVVPVHLVLLAASSTALLESVYAWAAAAQGLAYLAAAAGAAGLPRVTRTRLALVSRLTSAAYAFVLLNGAAFVAMVQFARGDEDIWARG